MLTGLPRRDTSTCIVCGEAEPEPLYPEVAVVRCGCCGFVYAEVAVDPTELYDRSYYEGRVYPDYARERRTMQRNARRRLRVIRPLLPAGSKIFEIGSAYGFFLEVAKEEYRVSGIEISEAAARYAREQVGVEVACGDFLALPDPPEPDVGLVCMWDTIEHLERPDLFLEKAHRWLAPGSGLVAVTTGDISSAVARRQGRKWRQLCPPLHLQFFSPETLTRLLERLGFEVVHLSRPGMYRSYRTTVTELFGRGRPARMLTLGDRMDFEFYINTFDLMFVLARRTG